ncbi:uncharacterized protein LOC111134965 [Crassostrea virginica]
MGRCRSCGAVWVSITVFFMLCNLVNTKGLTEHLSIVYFTSEDTRPISESTPASWKTEKLTFYTQSSFQPSTEYSAIITKAHLTPTKSLDVREVHFSSNYGTTNKTIRTKEAVSSSRIKSTVLHDDNNDVTPSDILEQGRTMPAYRVEGLVPSTDTLQPSVEIMDKSKPNNVKQPTTDSFSADKESYLVTDKEPYRELKEKNHYNRISPQSTFEIYDSNSSLDLQVMHTPSSEFGLSSLTSDRLEEVQVPHPSSIYFESMSVNISSPSPTKLFVMTSPSEIKPSAVVIKLPASFLPDNATILHPSRLLSSPKYMDQDTMESVTSQSTEQIHSVTDIYYHSQFQQTLHSFDLQSTYQFENSLSETLSLTQVTERSRIEQTFHVREDNVMDKGVSVQEKSESSINISSAPFLVTVDVGKGTDGVNEHTLESKSQINTVKKYSSENETDSLLAMYDSSNNAIIPTLSSPVTVHVRNHTDGEEGTRATESMPQNFNIKKTSIDRQNNSLRQTKDLFHQSRPTVSSNLNMDGSKNIHEIQEVTSYSALLEKDYSTVDVYTEHATTSLLDISPTASYLHSDKNTKNQGTYTEETMLSSITIEKSSKYNDKNAGADRGLFDLSPTTSSSFVIYISKSTEHHRVSTYETMSPEISKGKYTVINSINIKPNDYSVGKNGIFTTETKIDVTSENPHTKYHHFVQATSSTLEIIPTVSSLSTFHTVKNMSEHKNYTQEMHPQNGPFEEQSTNTSTVVQPLTDSFNISPTLMSFPRTYASQNVSQNDVISIARSKVVPNTKPPLKSSVLIISEKVLSSKSPNSLQPSESEAEILGNSFESIPISLHSPIGINIPSRVTSDHRLIEYSTKRDLGKDTFWSIVSSDNDVSEMLFSHTVNTLNSIIDTPISLIDTTMISSSVINPTSSAKTLEEETTVRRSISLDSEHSTSTEDFYELKTVHVSKLNTHGSSNQQQFLEVPFNTVLFHSTDSISTGKKTHVKSQQTISTSFSMNDPSYVDLGTSDVSVSVDFYWTTMTEPLLSSPIAKSVEFLSTLNSNEETHTKDPKTHYISPSLTSTSLSEMGATVYLPDGLKSIDPSSHITTTKRFGQSMKMKSSMNNIMIPEPTSVKHSISGRSTFSFFPSFSSEYMSEGILISYETQFKESTAFEMKEMTKNPDLNSVDRDLGSATTSIKSNLNTSTKKTDNSVSSSVISSNPLFASVVNHGTKIQSDIITSVSRSEDFSLSSTTGLFNTSRSFQDIVSVSYNRSVHDQTYLVNASKIHMKNIQSDPFFSSSALYDWRKIESSNLFLQKDQGSVTVTMLDDSYSVGSALYQSHISESFSSLRQSDSLTPVSVYDTSFMNTMHLASNAKFDTLSTSDGFFTEHTTNVPNNPSYTTKWGFSMYGTTIQPDNKYDTYTGYSVSSAVFKSKLNSNRMNSLETRTNEDIVLTTSFSKYEILSTERYSSEMVPLSTKAFSPSSTYLKSETTKDHGYDPSLESASTTVSVTFSVSTNAAPSSSVVFLFPENNLLVIEIDVKTGININDQDFIDKVVKGLSTIYIEGMSGRKRRSSNQKSDDHSKDAGISVKIRDINRKDGERVEIIFLVTYDGMVVSASLAEITFQKMSDIKMSAILGYPVVVTVSRLSTRKKSPPKSDGWGEIFNPLVIILITLPTSVVLIATLIAIALRCRSKSVHRYPSVASHMDSLYKHNLVVDVENGDVRNRRISYEYPSDDEYSMASSDVFNEIKSKYSQSMHSKIKNFEKLSIKNHFHNQLERKPSDALRNKVTFGLDSEDRKSQCVKTDSNESNDSGVVSDTPKSPTNETGNLKIEVAFADATIPQTAQNVQQNNSQVAPKTTMLQNPYPVKKKVSGERVTSWVFMGDKSSGPNEHIPSEQSERHNSDNNEPRTAGVSSRDCDHIPTHEDRQPSAGGHDGSPDHIYETLNRKETERSDEGTDPQTSSGISGSDGFEYLEPLRQLLLAVEQQRRRIPPVHQFLTDENVFRTSVQGLCNLGHLSPSHQSPQTLGPVPLVNSTNSSDSDKESERQVQLTDCTGENRSKERQLVQGSATHSGEVASPDKCIYDQPVGFAHVADI